MDPTKESEEVEEIVEVDKISEEDKEEEETPSRELRKPGRKRKIFEADNEHDTPEVLKAKKKKREIEYKLSKLKCTLNQDEQRVSGKRQKKAPERFELTEHKKRKSVMDNLPDGRGTPLGSITWTSHRLGKASLNTLRLLHRTIFRKQGNFIEKKIIKDVWKFRGFPFDANHPEIKKRRANLEKQKENALGSLCEVLGLRRGTHTEMVDAIISFLICPTQKAVDKFLGTLGENFQLPGSPTKYGSLTSNKVPLPFLLNPNLNNPDSIKNLCTPAYNAGSGTANAQWRKPVFFAEGNGVKLKYIRAVASNIEMANDNFIELLHRLLYLNVDEIQNMRKSILEFSGLKCEPGTHNYTYRTRILSLLPADQVKLICRVLGLPTWHRSRQLLMEGIMDFLVAPRISAMKRKVPPHFTDEISFSFETAKNTKPITESEEYEKIEVFPDIHILPDDEEDPPYEDCDSSSVLANEYLGVKLKNFANIYYQVISTPAAQLNDVHMIMYLTTSAQNSVRNNVLEFAGFPFDESSKEYFCRKSFMEHRMSLEELKCVASVLCVSQYIVDESKASLIDAILKFLLKPSALLNSSTIMPTPSIPQWCPVVKKQATSTSYTPPHMNNSYPDIVISEVKTLAKVEKKTHSPSNTITSTVPIQYEASAELERMKAYLSSDIQIMPVTSIKIEDSFEEEEPNSRVNDIQILPLPRSSIEDYSHEGDVPLSRVKNTVTMIPAPMAYIDSDDEDDRPLSKMIGHPNDEQLKALVTKIVKESKLEDVTMKIVIKKVFDNYPNFDLGYRKEFIKSIVRQVLSQMEDHTRVSTTVINI